MKVRLIKIINEADDVRSFRLERLFNYKAGQWMYITIHKAQETSSKSLSQDTSSNMKHMFTISASPTEDYLQFTTKFRDESEYKQELWKLTVGDEIEINGPFGGFVFDEKDRTPRVFLAGGIGITPFRSMKKYATDQNLNIPTILIASFKTTEEVIFKDLIDRVVITSDEGRIDAEKIKIASPDWKMCSFWICGPAGFVDGMKSLITKMGIEEGKIKAEDFPGY